MLKYRVFWQDWKLPSELHGCGNFANESWQIFCRGETCSKGIQDRFLKQYLSWLRTGKQGASATGISGSAKPQRSSEAPPLIFSSWCAHQCMASWSFILKTGTTGAAHWIQRMGQMSSRPCWLLVSFSPCIWSPVSPSTPL